MMYTYFRTLDGNPLAASQLPVGDAAVRVQPMSKRVVYTIAWTDGPQSSQPCPLHTSHALFFWMPSLARFPVCPLTKKD